MKASAPTLRDEQALALAQGLGLATLAPADVQSELTPQRAVERALAWLLAGVEARVEGNLQPLRPARVGEAWASGQVPAQYPTLTIRGRTTQERDALTGVPYQLAGADVLSQDERWALWRVGEDVGEGFVHVFTNHEPERAALVRAVEDALSGNLDTLVSLGLPLPEVFLPEPFRARFTPADFPRARVTLAGAATSVDDELAALGGIWRADVPFRWQAPRLAARPRLPDLTTAVHVTVATPET